MVTVLQNFHWIADMMLSIDIYGMKKVENFCIKKDAL
jgi:hypothetical protein